MRKLKFEVAYDGTDFNGWQVQPGLPTVQGVLEQVIGTIESSPVQVIGSGRTDAGVHALAQVAAVALQNPIPPDNFRRAVNRLLPHSIRIDRVAETCADFHPRFHALSKTYEYRIYRREVCPPFERRFVYYHPYPLDEAEMTAAANLLVGEHDFSSFAASDEKDKLNASKCRTIHSSVLKREGDRLLYRVTGSGFLKHMVRNIVGVLLEVGKGNLSQADVLARLEPGSGIRSGPAVPASGLFLVCVDYPVDMAAATHIPLTEFHARYANESGYEYWFGEVVRKSAPTWLHAILQSLLAEIFYEQGYFSGPELDLRISHDFQPRPDVAASLDLESTGYPTKPVDIVAEILSPDDSVEKVLEKCQHYTQLGIRQIYVFDPIARSAAQWNPIGRLLERIAELTLTNGAIVKTDDIFNRFAERLNRRPSSH